MGKRKRSKPKTKDSDKDLSVINDLDYVHHLSDNSDSMDDDDCANESQIPSTSDTNFEKTIPHLHKFKFDPNNISKSAPDLIESIKQSTIPKRDILSLVDSIQAWLEIYNIQTRENKYLTDTNQLLLQNNQSLQNAINGLNQTQPKTFADKVKSSQRSAVEHVAHRHDNVTNNSQTHEHAHSRQQNPSTESNAIWKKFSEKPIELPKPKKVYVIEAPEKTGKTAKEIFSSLIDATKLKLKIDRIVVGKQNRAVLWPKDEEQIKIIQNELTKRNITEITLRESKEHLFKVHINNVNLENREDYKTLNKNIAELNEELNITADEIRPLFASKNSSESYCVVFGVSNEVRKKLIKTQRIYIGYSAHKVFDYFEPMLCYKCNKYGHSSAKCKTDLDTVPCTNCGVFGHQANACAKEKTKGKPHCPSCHDWAKRMKINDSKSFAHWPRSVNCPTREILINREKQQLNDTNNEQ